MRKLVVAGLGIGVLLALAAAPAAAGGWAVPAFDPLPPIEAGRPAAIGLTILQHGVHPADVDDVALVYVADDGTTFRFAAEPDGRPGHYVAQVELPAGSYRWSVQPGWFPEHDLGPVTVRDSASSAIAPVDERVAPPPVDDGGASALRLTARVALPVLALVAAAVAIGVPRRRRAVLATP
jgi:hypothetical protein